MSATAIESVSPLEFIYAPFGILNLGRQTGNVERRAEVPWLAKKYAMTVLPSVSSLRALRHFARATLASRPFIGFGDPKLKGDP